MQIISDKAEIVYRKEYNGKPSYAIGLSKKNKEGKYVNGYIKAFFRKGVELNHKTKIKIIEGWLDFYKDNDKIIPTLFINNFEVVKEEQKEEITNNTNLFEEFGEHITTGFDVGQQIQIEDEDLPF